MPSRSDSSAAVAASAELAHDTKAAATPSTFRDILSLTKPRLSSLVLFTAGGGLALAPDAVPASQALAGIVGTTLVVAGANALNCYLERDSDRLMTRTALRPLPQQRLQPATGLVVGLALSISAVGILTLATPPLAGLLASAALLLYVLVYTPMKRTSSLSVLVGAVPGALPPVIGWVAATGSIDPPALVLFGIMFLWQVPHSLAISIYRQDEYTRAGLVVHSAEHGLASTRRQMLVYTMGLFPVPLLLVHLGVAGMPTAVVGSALGAVLLYSAFEGWRLQAGARWARKYFRLTLMYMTGLFAVLVIDHWF